MVQKHKSEYDKQCYSRSGVPSAEKTGSATRGVRGGFELTIIRAPGSIDSVPSKENTLIAV